jgi:two-component system chemotaxis sensor kinase CheA
MTGLDLKLTQQIDRALQDGTLDTSATGGSETLAGLFSLVNEYLAQPVPAPVRKYAVRVAGMSESRDSESAGEEQFRAALVSLRDGLREQQSQDETFGQFASDPELVQEFLVEASEHLVGVEAGLLTLEREPGNAEALNGVFRSFHTIKGLAGFLGASAIQELAHETENILDLARSGGLSLSAGIIDLILKAADELSNCLEKGKTQNLNRIPRCDQRLLSALSEAARPAEAPPRSSAAPGAIAESKSTDPAGRSLVNQGGSVVRIDTAKLEYLIDMVGELVIAESVVRHDPMIAASEDPLLSRHLTHLARVVREVQKTSMSMRMVAVGTLFGRMNRLTRDLARRLGKSIELTTVGDDVELDRSIVEELADPIVHMIRNSVDHGLESPAERVEAGKPATGRIHLRAMHDAGDIVIEVGDDGRGMDPARILSKAKRLGMVGQNEAPDEDSIFGFIFEPGFSTLDKVTELSGRGVGMDVVKKQIQKLRGRIAIRSAPGQGCSFVLRLPLTLAIVDGLVVAVGGQRYILPMFVVREMFSPGPDTFVTLENRTEAALFRDKLLPVIRLSRLFDPRPAQRQDGVLIVVEGRDQLYCIAVDQLIGKQEVVIKSLGRTFRDVPAIAGGAILGDGRVGLIIDVNSLRYQN